MKALDAAHSTDTPPQRLARLAQSRNPQVRAAVAANPHTAQGTLRRLFGDKEVAVVKAVVSNPNLPEDVA